LPGKDKLANFRFSSFPDQVHPDGIAHHLWQRYLTCSGVSCQPERQEGSSAHRRRACKRWDNKLCSEAAKKRQDVFSYRIDELNIRQIDEESRAVSASHRKHPGLLGIFAGESTFEPELHGTGRIEYLDAQHLPPWISCPQGAAGPSLVPAIEIADFLPDI
jgi:hypothetical protein